MRTRVPLRCVQATAAAATARFRLWTEPAESDYEGSLDFKGRAAAFHGTRRASGRVLQTVSLPDATFLREPGQPAWMRLHSSRWRQGSWDPFGVLDVVAALPQLVPLEPEPTQRGALQHHVGRLDAAALERLADEASTVMRRVRPLPPAADDGASEIGVWLDSRLRIHRVRYRTSRPRAALLHFDLFDFARPVRVEIPARFESVDLDAVRGALRGEGEAAAGTPAAEVAAASEFGAAAASEIGAAAASGFAAAAAFGAAAASEIGSAAPSGFGATAAFGVAAASEIASAAASEVASAAASEMASGPRPA